MMIFVRRETNNVSFISVPDIFQRQFPDLDYPERGTKQSSVALLSTQTSIQGLRQSRVSEMRELCRKKSSNKSSQDSP